MNKINQKIFVSTVTKRGFEFLPNVINNFKRQTYKDKKLTIVFTCNIDKEKVKEELEKNELIDCDFYIFPYKNQWDCHKFTATLIPTDYSIWAKMDDDDYYGPNYLYTNLKSMIYSTALIVGRSNYYIYIPESDELFYKESQGINRFVKHIAGASLFLHKNIFKYVTFNNLNSAGDVDFINRCLRKGFRIFSSANNDFVVVRSCNNNNHTWKINLNNYLSDTKKINSSLFVNKKEHVFHKK